MRLTCLFAVFMLWPVFVDAFEVPRAAQAPVIDANPSDAAWDGASWRLIDQVVLGDGAPSNSDFRGRYKLVWTSDALYLLAEIHDDVLIDSHVDPLAQYWNDDLIEVFVDEDHSGGLHRDDFNAFAYHIGLDNRVVDIAPSAQGGTPMLFPGHVSAQWRRGSDSPFPVYWEAKIAIHNDQHQYGDDASSRVELIVGKTMGFAVAYCDADDEQGRQHFMSDVAVAPVDGDRNRAYIDASVFGQITLVD